VAAYRRGQRSAGSLSAASASGTLLLARRAEKRELLAAGADVAEVGLTEGEKRELLGGRDVPLR
jgi:hypothetical protein